MCYFLLIRVFTFDNTGQDDHFQPSFIAPQVIYSNDNDCTVLGAAVRNC